MRESIIEKKGNLYANMLGISTYKFTSPNRASVPDRIWISKIPNWLRPIISNYIRFVEYKAPGKDPTVKQKREHERLRNLGFVVEVVDDVKLAQDIANEMVK